MYESLLIDVERWSGGQLKEIQGNCTKLMIGIS